MEKSFIQETLSHLKEANKIKYSTLSALGTYLVLYTSIIPFSNNILEVFYPHIKTTYIPVADAKMSTVIWCLGMCLQPSILILLKAMRPYTLAYALPIFTSLYSSAFYGLYLLGKKPNEDFWFFFYLILLVLIIISIMHSINLVLRIQKIKEKAYMNAIRKNNPDIL